MPEEKKERPQDRWDKKAVYVSKSYKLKKDAVDTFASVCDKARVFQALQLKK